MCLIIDNRYHRGKEKKFKVCKPKEISCYKILYYSDKIKKFIAPFRHIEIPRKNFYIESESFQEKPINSYKIYWNTEKQKAEKREVCAVDYGIHAYTDYYYASGKLLDFPDIPYRHEIMKPCLIRCFVEKGVKFWMGKDHQICAEKLRLDDKFICYKNPELKFKRK